MPGNGKELNISSYLMYKDAHCRLQLALYIWQLHISAILNSRFFSKYINFNMQLSICKQSRTEQLKMIPIGIRQVLFQKKIFGF